MEIIQVNANDRQQPLQNFRTRTFFVINAHLDEEILRDALDRLIRVYWRKLGARLASRPEDGRLAYYLPCTFGEKYQLFNWSSQAYNHSINMIPSLPKPTPPEEGISLLPPLRAVEDWFRPSDWPLDRKSEPPDTPLLYIHMSHFTDATVLAISCPHVVVDQFGKANIVKAWLGLVKGEAPPPMVGFKDDIFANGKSYADYNIKKVARKGMLRVRRWGEYLFVILGFIPQLILNRKEDSYTTFLPLPLVETLREQHEKELTAKYGADPGLSNGDIITAILLKLSRMHIKSSQMLALTQIVNLRGRIPQLDCDRNAFIHNAMHYSSAHFQINRSTPLSEIAYQNRKAIIRSLDQKEIDMSMAIVREMVRRGQIAHICEPFETFYFVTNWCAAWKGLDFEPAVKKQGKDMDKSAPLKLFVLGESKMLGAPERFSPNILCKTAEGYWCNFSVPRKTSRLIREYLKTDPTLKNL